MKNAGLILFDCDGTMTDSHGLIVRAMQQAFADCQLNEPTAAAVQAITGLSLTIAIEQLGAPSVLQERIAELYGNHYRADEGDIRLFPGVHETLSELQRRGYWLGVVTGKSKAGLMRVLERLELSDYFYVIRTADCTHSKPHPAMVLESMAELGVNAGQTTVIGDAVFDIDMATAAGVKSIGVSFGAASTEKLLHAGAVLVVDDFADLLHSFPNVRS